MSEEFKEAQVTREVKCGNRRSWESGVDHTGPVGHGEDTRSHRRL